MANFKILIVILCTVILTEAQRSLDLTLEPGSSGSEVVRATISKIVFSNIQFTSDSTGGNTEMDVTVAPFLRTMAYIETRDGVQLNTDGGGIWNIGRAFFDDTKQRMTEYSEVIVQLNQTDQFNHIGPVDWNSITYEDLSIPLYSGLVARIMMSLSQVQLPSPINSYYYWKSLFKTTIDGIIITSLTVENWEDYVSDLAQLEEMECTVDTDLVFVLDESGSIGVINFQNMKNFVQNFSSAYLRNETKTKVGVITFNSEATEQIPLNSTFGSDMILEQISQLPYNRGGTNTAEALELMRQQSWRDEVSVLRLAIVITDGMSNNAFETVLAAQKVHQHTPQILVYAIGVGGNINQTELQIIIASRPETYSHLDNFSASSLDSVGTVFSYQICFTESQNLNISDEEFGRLGRGVTTRLRYLIPVVDGLTFRICLSSGRIIIYASTLPNPGRAQYSSRSEVAANSLPLNCLTMFFELGMDDNSMVTLSNQDNNRRRKRRQVSPDMVTIFITLEGRDDENVFSFSSHGGNVTIDENECEGEPCGPNEDCFNTDGSYYCSCSGEYVRNGTVCSAVPEKDDSLSISLSISMILVVIIAIVFTIMIILIVRYRTKLTQKKQKEDEQPLSEPDGLLEVDEDMFSHQGPERFVPTMVKKYENMATDTQDDKKTKTTNTVLEAPTKRK